MAVAQPPSTLSYQAYLTDRNGTPVDGLVEIRFALYAVDVGGISLWTERQMVSVDRGLMNAELGTFVPLNLADFNAPLFLGITVERDPEMQPRQRLLSAPYALRAVVPSCIPGMRWLVLPDHLIVRMLANVNEGCGSVPRRVATPNSAKVNCYRRSRFATAGITIAMVRWMKAMSVPSVVSRTGNVMLRNIAKKQLVTAFGTVSAPSDPLVVLITMTRSVDAMA